MAERAVTWTYDASHYPEPMTPLSAAVWFDAMGYGIREAAKELRAPFGGFETMTADGGWAYEHELDAAWEFDPAAYEQQALDVARRWEDEYEPLVDQITSELRALRPERGDSQTAVRDL